MRETDAEIVLSLDDDSYPIEPDAIAAHPRALYPRPHTRRGQFSAAHGRISRDDSPRRISARARVGAFASSSVALRRSIYLDVGGYETWSVTSTKSPIMRYAATPRATKSLRADF